MRGVTFSGNRRAEIGESPAPHAGPGEAVLRIRASGLCGSDLHRYRGPEPEEMISGHEPCGVIEELGPGAPPGLRLGDRVMCHHYAGCGTCEICAMGCVRSFDLAGRGAAPLQKFPTLYGRNFSWSSAWTSTQVQELGPPPSTAWLF